jgi:TonB family protein
MNTRMPSVLILAAALSATAFTPLAAADQPPRAIAQPSPAYPFDLRKAKFEGEATLMFTVTADGRVADPVVVQASNWVFRDLALAAITRWKYAPALEGGRPVAVKVRQPFIWEMREKAAARAAALAAGKRLAAAAHPAPAVSR